MNISHQLINYNWHFFALVSLLFGFQLPLKLLLWRHWKQKLKTWQNPPLRLQIKKSSKNWSTSSNALNQTVHSLTMLPGNLASFSQQVCTSFSILILRSIYFSILCYNNCFRLLLCLSERNFLFHYLSCKIYFRSFCTFNSQQGFHFSFFHLFPFSFLKRGDDDP